MGRVLNAGLFGLLAFGVCVLASPVTHGEDPDEEQTADIKQAAEAMEALNKLTDAMANGAEKDIPKLSQKLYETTDFKHIQWAAFKTRARGGVGVGEIAGSVIPDGIEAKIIALQTKPLSEAQLKKEAAELIRMGRVVQAIAEVNDLDTPKKDDGLRKVADWTKSNKDQKAGALELIDAVKANEPAKVQGAAKALYTSCTNCHVILRLPAGGNPNPANPPPGKPQP